MYLRVVADLALSIDPSVSALLARVSCFLSGQGIKAYLTGGFVRDWLMERAAGDIDIAVAGDALETALEELSPLSGNELRAKRREKFLEMGKAGLG